MMKKLITFLILFALLAFTACDLETPEQPQLNISSKQLALSKVVFIGNSLTAGFQSAGLVKDLQKNSFPYLIAQQMGNAHEFQMPLIDDPGISIMPGAGVLSFNPSTGEIAPRGNYTNPTALLLNATLPRPYDNLGIPGATLKQALDAATGVQADTNSFFDLILRNPNFANMTMVEQAQVLNPTFVIVWLGNNDVLGAAVSGGDLTQITPAQDFQADYGRLLQELAKIREGNVGIILANIPNVTDIPYVNLLDDLVYKT
ncbi:MAG: hypothetical protein GWN00_34535, partial [Aliifodinibius sp.]|nr:hypothetical protein [Fodinibius sp.]NIV15820.1 hypothetical protein [Fodinibius sp.]NIY29721.1 hypothetical protein [Fodinibius sp.]